MCISVVFRAAIDLRSVVSRKNREILLQALHSSFNCDIRTGFPSLKAWEICVFMVFITSFDSHSGINGSDFDRLF
jgi:hypothetical protein